MNDSINTETREDVMQRVDELQGKLRDQLEKFNSDLQMAFTDDHWVEKVVTSEDLTKTEILLSVMLTIKDQIERLVLRMRNDHREVREENQSKLLSFP